MEEAQWNINDARDQSCGFFTHAFLVRLELLGVNNLEHAFFKGYTNNNHYRNRLNFM